MDKYQIDKILKGFYQSKSPKTADLYQTDLDSFRDYLGVDNLETALISFFESPHSQANLTVLHYKSLMQRGGLKPATINRRLSALRSLVKGALQDGHLRWKIDINNEKKSSETKIKPLSVDSFDAMLKLAEGQRNPLKSARDVAIIRLLHDLAMQRTSIVNLNYSDISFRENSILVNVPCSKSKIKKFLPVKTAQSLLHWVSFRGKCKGPLFTNCDHAGKGKRLTGTSIYRIVHQFGKQIGVETGPFGLRQTAIIKALDKAKVAGLSMSEIAAFSDHQHVSSLKAYNKHRARVQLRLSDLVSE
jgi:integrase/recombinase XerC